MHLNWRAIRINSLDVPGIRWLWISQLSLSSGAMMGSSLNVGVTPMLPLFCQLSTFLYLEYLYSCLSPRHPAIHTRIVLELVPNCVFCVLHDWQRWADHRAKMVRERERPGLWKLIKKIPIGILLLSSLKRGTMSNLTKIAWMLRGQDNCCSKQRKSTSPRISCCFKWGKVFWDRWIVAMGFADIFTGPRSINFKKSWRMCAMPQDRRPANVDLSYKGEGKDLGNYQQSSLTSVQRRY